MKNPATQGLYNFPYTFITADSLQKKELFLILSQMETSCQINTFFSFDDKNLKLFSHWFNEKTSLAIVLDLFRNSMA